MRSVLKPQSDAYFNARGSAARDAAARRLREAAARLRPTYDRLAAKRDASGLL